MIESWFEIVTGYEDAQYIFLVGGITKKIMFMWIWRFSKTPPHLKFERRSMQLL
jgi:hypothetical protein